MTSILIQLSKDIFRCKELFVKHNIYESMRPFYYVARFYGLAPLQFGINDPHITEIDFFLVALNFICYLFIIYVQMAFENVYKHGVMCVDIGIKVLYFVTTFASLTTLIRILVNRYKICAIFDQLNKIDVEVNIFFTHLLINNDFRNFVFSLNLMELQFLIVDISLFYHHLSSFIYL